MRKKLFEVVLFIGGSSIYAGDDRMYVVAEDFTQVSRIVGADDEIREIRYLGHCEIL